MKLLPIKRFRFALLLGLFALSITQACKKDDDFSLDPSLKLAFSTDSILFDTVFTQLGGGNDPRSLNKQFLVYNHNNNAVKTTVRLGGGPNSPYRINVDGESGVVINDIEIAANDSIFVFVEVTLDQNNTSSPLIVLDSIIFETNGNMQHVMLAAWGRDAHYYPSVQICDEVWSDKEKPYVIYNNMLVPPGCTLTINAGAHVHSNPRSIILVQGTLIVNGTTDEPVVFQGDRLEYAMRNVSGQWGGIWFLRGSIDNRMNNTVVKNGVFAARVDSLSENSNPNLRLFNSIFLNQQVVGLTALTAQIEATNCVFANCGQFTFFGDIGGDYHFRHCTFANFNTSFNRKNPQFGFADVQRDDNDKIIRTFDLAYKLENCIIYGSEEEELIFDVKNKDAATQVFDHCLLKTKLAGFNINNNLLNLDPKFKNFKDLDFSLDSLSPAKDAGAVLVPPVTTDIKNNPRDAQPDLGAYEREN